MSEGYRERQEQNSLACSMYNYVHSILPCLSLVLIVSILGDLLTHAKFNTSEEIVRICIKRLFAINGRCGWRVQNKLSVMNCLDGSIISLLT